jgi:hypothetical protein
VSGLARTLIFWARMFCSPSSRYSAGVARMRQSQCEFTLAFPARTFSLRGTWIFIARLTFVSGVQLGRPSYTVARISIRVKRKVLYNQVLMTDSQSCTPATCTVADGRVRCGPDSALCGEADFAYILSRARLRQDRSSPQTCVQGHRS